MFCPVYMCVPSCLETSSAQASAFVAVGGLSARVGLPCMMWWIDPKYHTAAQSLSPSSSRTGEREGKAKVRKLTG